jgi:hypothetical protein
MQTDQVEKVGNQAKRVGKELVDPFTSAAQFRRRLPPAKLFKRLLLC